MSDRAKVNIIGRLAQKPEVRTNNSGKQYMTFSVASNYYDSFHNQQFAMFFSCVASERHLAYLQQAEVGDKVDLVGKLTPNMYTDKQGITHDNYNVLVDDIDITHKPTGGTPVFTDPQRLQSQRTQAAAGPKYQQNQNGQNQYQRQPQQIPAPQPQKQNGYYYEQNPFDEQNQGEGEGFRPATYSY